MGQVPCGRGVAAWTKVLLHCRTQAASRCHIDGTSLLCGPSAFADELIFTKEGIFMSQNLKWILEKQDMQNKYKIMRIDIFQSVL